MTCSPAQLEANRRNAERSTGPRTAEGKAISRRNGLKHGLTGAGIVLPHEDAGDVERRFEALEAELRPNSELARHLVGRVALMMLRLERSAEHEAKAIAHRMRHAAGHFDEARLAEVDHLMAWIASEPATNARRLRETPEGIERLIAGISRLRADLARVGGYRWGYDHSEQLHHLLGLRSVDLPVSRVRALTEAIHGNFQWLDVADGPILEGDPRRVWAIGELVYFMDAELDRLKGLLEGLDREGLELDRAEASARVMFDDSKEAILARKYESASERAMYRALRELREIQAEVQPEHQFATDPPAEMGSLFPESRDEQDAEQDPNPTIAKEPRSPSRRRPDPAKLARNERRRPKSR